METTFVVLYLVRLFLRIRFTYTSSCGVVHKRVIAQLLVALIHNLMPPLQFLRPVAIMNHRFSSDYNTLVCAQALCYARY